MTIIVNVLIPAVKTMITFIVFLYVEVAMV